jgi:hypothetical protein
MSKRQFSFGVTLLQSALSKNLSKILNYLDGIMHLFPKMCVKIGGGGYPSFYRRAGSLRNVPILVC